jgi:hypothetical protein
MYRSKPLSRKAMSEEKEEVDETETDDLRFLTEG